MKRLFERKEKDTDLGGCWSISNYNFSNLPPITVVHSRENRSLPNTLRSLPTLPFDRVVIHCYQTPTPEYVALLYELRRVVVPDESVVLLFHHKGGKDAKRWRNAMRLMGFPSRSSDGFVSVWSGGPDDFEPPRCKTERSLEEQTSRFYRALLRDVKRLLEVFPRVGSVSQKALALGIPVTVFISGRDENALSLIKRLGGQFP